MNDFDKGHKLGVFEALVIANHAEEKGLDVVHELERFFNTIAERAEREAEESE